MTYAVTGIPSSYRAPLTAFELIFGQGASSAAAGVRSAIYIGKMLSGGTATVNTRYAITSEGQAETLFGPGSDLHIFARTHIAKNPNGKVYMVAHAPSSGAGVATATANLTVTGTATANGSFIVEVCGEQIEIVYFSGDTPTVIGDILEARINAMGFLPVTAANTTGTVAVSAKAAGASQNGIYMLLVVQDGDSGSSVSVAASAEYLAAGAEGATTEVSLFSAALTAVAGSSDYYHGIPQTIATFSTPLKTHIENRSLPLAGNRSRGYFPSSASQSAAGTIATGLNYERMHCVWQRGASQPPQVLVAWAIASIQKEEQVQRRFNFDNYPATDFIKPAPDQTDWPTHESDLGDAINSGLMVIASTDTGTYMAMAVNTRSKDATGALDDFRASEAHRVSIIDGVADIVGRNHRLTYVNFAQQADPLLPDGVTVDIPALALISGRQVTPYKFRSWFLQQLQPFFDEELQGPDEWEAATNCQIDPANNGRMQVVSAGRTIDLHHQATFRISETTPN